MTLDFVFRETEDSGSNLLVDLRPKADRRESFIHFGPPKPDELYFFEELNNCLQPNTATS